MTFTEKIKNIQAGSKKIVGKIVNLGRPRIDVDCKSWKTRNDALVDLKQQIKRLLGFEVIISLQHFENCEKDVTYHFTITSDTNYHVATFKLMQMPGCCGMLISFNSYIDPNQRRKGLGTLLHSFRLQFARRLGYSYMICTDRLENEAQRTLLNKFKWEDLATFTNQRTDNKLALSGIKLQELKSDRYYSHSFSNIKV